MEHKAITPSLLRDWNLPEAEGSKYSRGQVVVVGGARRAPGAAMLAGVASLRAGAGRLTLAIADSVATAVAVAVPESGVAPLAETADGHVRGDSLTAAESDLASADAVLVGPGLDDAEQAAALLARVPNLVSDAAIVVLDAFALGVLEGLIDEFRPLAGRLVLTPNAAEAERLLGREAEISLGEVDEIAKRYGAVVSCEGLICDGEGRRWKSGTGTVGLGTSGSGDVLAGIIAGLAARGASPAQAAVWGTHVHGAAGDRLGGSVGYLARELANEIPVVMSALG
jgi:hydroxyethylthiazole kinase-like uncharacterized protein yjeF